MRSKVTVKISVCWATTFNIDGTYIIKMEFIVSSFEISLIGKAIQSVRPNHFIKKLLKYIFMELEFINI